jgi:hypothetical protein
MRAAYLKYLPLILLLVHLSSAAKASSQTADPKPFLPVVVAASVPFYPRICQMAHIVGIVQLRIHTDGSRASTIDVESGQPMLAKAAQENVGTWRFQQHSPTTFEVTFHYNLLDSTCDAQCECGSKEKESVLLQFPNTVEVNAAEVMTCAPVKENK